MLLNKSTYSKLLFFRTGLVGIILLSFINCSSSNDDVQESSNIPEFPETEPIINIDARILSLGDSYTFGTSVCDTCSYPVQLKDSLLSIQDPNYDASIDIIAAGGWTTTKLLEEIDNSNLDKDFDLVTLLIGVNNQFQSRPFELYETEFISLLNQAIQFARDDEDKVIVLSIPDYAYSIFGQNWGNPETTSMEIDAYNAYAQSICENLNITFLNVTDISRQALMRPELLASDGLHLSELAYNEFVERLLPIAREKLETN